MTYINFKDIPKHIGISDGDKIFVSSDIKKLAFACYSNRESFNTDLFIDSLIDAVGENGTLVFPTYNWGFCKGDTFDYLKTKSKVGSLTNAALKRMDFRRTMHPIYSFAVRGKDAEALCALNNKSSFGADSPFAYFYEKGFKNLFIDVDYKNSATFVHYCEEKNGVSYRFIKDFTADYIDETGASEHRTYSMYVRPLDVDVTVTINPMHEVFLVNGAVEEYIINSILFKILDMRKAYNLVEQDILHNKSKRIAIYPGQNDQD